MRGSDGLPAAADQRPMMGGSRREQHVDWRQQVTGIVLLLVTACGWGANWPILKVLLSELPPLTARGWAGLAAASGLFVTAKLCSVSLHVERPARIRLAAAAFLNVTAWMGFTTLGLWWVDASQGAILAYTMPIWTAILAWALLGTRPGPLQLIGLALGCGGVWTVLDPLKGGLDPARLPGVAFILAGAVLFALGTVATKRWPLPLAPVAATMWQVGLGCLPLLLLSFPLEGASLATLSLGGWAALIYMAAGPLCLCYISWFAALKRLPPGAATIGTLLAPIVGVIASGIWLGEPLGTRESLALGLTVAGICLATAAPHTTRGRA